MSLFEQVIEAVYLDLNAESITYRKHENLQPK